ncbi:hypothetical protein FQN55_008771 [Onygenales sp. PD_40]|nr:hypothetical protein FQN55_008771 [Onygenales sp. PD_40]
MGFNEAFSYDEHQHEVNKRESSKNGSVDRIDQTDAPLSDKDEIYEVRKVPGRGMGCFATRKIPKGTRIILEEPLFIVPEFSANIQLIEKNMLKELKGLTKEQQRSFFDLANAHTGKCSPVVGTIKTNAMPFGARGSVGGVFPRAARINHSCKPNSQNIWNQNLQKLTIHNFKDIEEGEEITIAYIDGVELSDARRELLDDAFGFRCVCEVCAISDAETKARDDRLEEMERLDLLLGDGRRMMNQPLECLHDAHTIFRMLNDEGIEGSRIARVYNDALQISIAHSDQARAKVFAQRAYTGRLILEGADSAETMRLKALVKKPSGHGLYGSSQMWAQSAAAIPTDLSEEEFESWLWRKNEKASS